MTESDEALSRQEQIWAGLYGPPRARELIEEAKEILGGSPGSSTSQVFADLNARLAEDDDDDLDEAGTMRPI